MSIPRHYQGIEWSLVNNRMTSLHSMDLLRNRTVSNNSSYLNEPLLLIDWWTLLKNHQTRPRFLTVKWNLSFLVTSQDTNNLRFRYGDTMLILEDSILRVRDFRVISAVRMSILVGVFNHVSVLDLSSLKSSTDTSTGSLTCSFFATLGPLKPPVTSPSLQI